MTLCLLSYHWSVWRYKNQHKFSERSTMSTDIVFRMLYATFSSVSTFGGIKVEQNFQELDLPRIWIIPWGLRKMGPSEFLESGRSPKPYVKISSSLSSADKWCRLGFNENLQPDPLPATTGSVGSDKGQEINRPLPSFDLTNLMLLANAETNN